MRKTLTTLAIIGSLANPSLAGDESIKDLKEYANYTANFEGRRPKGYDPNPDDGKPEPTIGVGHYLGRPDSRKTFLETFPNVNYNAVLLGKQELTNEQIDTLFAVDLPKYVKIAKSFFPKFDSYSLDLRKALVDGCYRGDISDSPKTRSLIIEGKFVEAGIEYTNRDDYRQAPAKGQMGIVHRIQKNRAAILNESKK